MTNPRWFMMVLLGFGLGACEEAVAIDVKCGTTWAPSIECDVSETLGKSEVEACWDYDLTCANGKHVTAERTCQKVADGNTVKTVIPAAKLTGYSQCGGDTAPVGILSGLTLNGQRTR